MDGGVVGSELQGGAVTGRGLVKLAFGDEGVAEVGHGFDGVWIDGERDVILSDRVVGISFGGERAAEGNVGGDVIGLHFNGAVIFGYGVVRLAVLGERIGEVE